MLIFGRQNERLLSENKRLREELDEALNRQGVRQLDDPHISAHDGSTAKRKADTTCDRSDHTEKTNGQQAPSTLTRCTEQPLENPATCPPHKHRGGGLDQVLGVKDE